MPIDVLFSISSISQYSPDGSQILGGAPNLQLKLWNADEGAEEVSLSLEQHARSCAFSPCGKRIVVALRDRRPRVQTKVLGDTVQVWEVELGQPVGSFPCEYVISCAYSTDGRFIVSTSQTGVVQFWDAETLELQDSLQAPITNITCSAYSPDGCQLLIAGEFPSESEEPDHALVILALNSKRPLATLSGHSDAVSCCAYSPDSQWIVSGGKDQLLFIWDARTGEMIRQFEGHRDEVTCCAFTADGAAIISGSLSGEVKFWVIDGAVAPRIETIGLKKIAEAFGGGGICGVFRGRREALRQEKRLANFLGQSPQFLRHALMPSMAFMAERQVFAKGDEEGNIQLQGLGVLRTTKGHESRIMTSQFSPDDRRLATGSLDKSLRLWDLKLNLQAVFEGHSDAVYGCCFSPDGSRLVSASADSTLRVWDVSGCLIEREKTLEGHTDSVWDCAYSPLGDRIVSASSDRTLKLWDVRGFEFSCLATLEGHTGEVHRCVYSPCGRWIASYAWHDSPREDREWVHIWGGYDGNLLAEIQVQSVDMMAFFPDSKRLVTATKEGILQLWNVPDGKEVGFFVIPQRPAGMAISADSTHIAFMGIMGEGDASLSLLELKGYEVDAPWLTATYYYDFILGGDWLAKPHARCRWCLRIVRVPASIQRVLLNYYEEESYWNERLWQQTELESTCPSCRKPIRFNPFIADCLVRYLFRAK